MRNPLWIYCVIGALTTSFLVSSLPAQPRDAGSKLRGEVGRSRAASARSTQGTVAVYPRPTTGSSSAYEAYSVDPLPFGEGDTVKVIGDGAKLRIGQRTLGELPPGQQLHVRQIRGPWVGTVAVVDGRNVGGWVWYSQVAPSAE